MPGYGARNLSSSSTAGCNSRVREVKCSHCSSIAGRLPGELPTDDIYVGIELVNPSGNGRGVFNKRSLFKTKLHHAALVPLSGVLPASTFDTAIPSAALVNQVWWSMQ